MHVRTGGQSEQLAIDVELSDYEPSTEIFMESCDEVILEDGCREGQELIGENHKRNNPNEERNSVWIPLRESETND